MKKYIVYRKYSTIFVSEQYERVELSEKELINYIEKHAGELKNIDIFETNNKVKIDMNITLQKY